MGRKPVPFIDGHNDVLLALHLAGHGAGAFLARRSEGHLDLVRGREGGFAAGVFAVFVLPESEEERAATRIPDRKPPYALPLAGPVPTEYAVGEAGAMVDLLDDLAASGEVRVARSTADVQAALEGGPLAAILHFEGAEPIEPELGNLPELYERGLRSIGLVWSRSNAFAQGVPFRFPSTPDVGEGLTAAGGVDPDAPLVRVVDHVDYVVERIGIDHVGFGSDFDGCILPIELGDAAGLQRVAAALRDRGYKDEQVVKLAHGNWLRVLDETWA